MADIPFLEAKVDMIRVNRLSAEEIASQARSLSDRWQTMEPDKKRGIVELITDKIMIGKEEININFCHSPSGDNGCNG